MFMFLSELKCKKLHQCIWKKFRKRLHFIRNSGLKKFCPINKSPDKSSAGLTRLDCSLLSAQHNLLPHFRTWRSTWTTRTSRRPRQPRWTSCFAAWKETPPLSWWTQRMSTHWWPTRTASTRSSWPRLKRSGPSWWRLTASLFRGVWLMPWGRSLSGCIGWVGRMWAGAWQRRSALTGTIWRAAQWWRAIRSRTIRTRRCSMRRLVLSCISLGMWNMSWYHS